MRRLRWRCHDHAGGAGLLMNLLGSFYTAARDRTLYLLAFVALCVLALAYQVRTPYLIDVGARNDRPFVVAFNGPEKVEEIPFRWSRRTSEVVLPGLGVGAAKELSLQLRGYRPDYVPTRVTLLVNGHPLTTLRVSDAFRKFTFDLEPLALQDADLRIQIRSRTFSTTNDPRQLGVMVDIVRVDPSTQWRVIVPSWQHVLWATLGIVSLYLLVQAVGLSRRTAVVLAALTLAGAAIAVGWFRLWLTPIVGSLVQNLWLAGACGAALFLVLRRVWLTHRVVGLGDETGLAWLTLIFTFALWFAYSGLTNPNFAPVDHLFRAHLMGDVLLDLPRAQEFYFTNPQADAWGGSFIFPYPPTFDVLFGPLRAVLPFDDQLVPVLSFLAAFLYASSVYPLYVLTLKLVPNETRAGLIAAFVWVVMPLNFLPLSDGAFPNLFGEWLLLIFLAAFAEHYRHLQQPRVLASLTLLLFFTCIAYSPTMLFVLLLLGIFIVLRLLFARTREEWARVRALGMMLGAALAAAFLIYYGRFVETMLFGTLPAMLGRLGAAGAIGRSPFMSGGWPLPDELIAHFRVIPAAAALFRLA